MKVLVVNTERPRVERVASELRRRGDLAMYVRAFASRDRSWERTLNILPVIANSLSRRRLADPALVPYLREGGQAADVGLDVLRRMASVWPTAAERLRRRLAWRRGRALDASASRVSSGVDLAFSPFGASRVTFEALRAAGGARVLDYPLTHHRATQRLLNEEKNALPEFAGTLNSFELPSVLTNRLDRECELADRILVGSSFARDSFLDQGFASEQVLVTPYGVDTGLFQPDTEGVAVRTGDALRLLFVGQLTQRKGIGYLVEAFRRSKKPGDRLTMVGPFVGDRTWFRRYGSMVDHVPQVPRSELPPLYRNADVFVFPTIVEGMPLVVLEAMACGLPVIATPNGPGDVVTDGTDGFIVPPRDIDAIIDRLGWLRRNPERRAEMGRNASERARDFSWHRYLEQTLGVFEDAVRNRGERT